MPRPRPDKQSDHLDFPEVPPIDEILERRDELDAFVTQMNDREDRRRRNGSAGMRTADAKEKRAELLARMEQLPAAPPLEWLTEYVVDYDNSGNIIGLTPAS